MKNIRWLFILILILALCGCFSEWAGDEGTITISLGGFSRALDDPDRIPNFEYAITLNGPGGIVERRFTGKNAVMRVVPGQWNIRLKAYFCTLDGNEMHEYLQAIGFQTVNVKAGWNQPAYISMISASEVESFLELCAYVSNHPYTEEIIIIKNDISTAEDEKLPLPLLKSISISENSKIILIAEKDVTISSNILFGTDVTGALPRGFFDVIPGTSLTLGMAGMSGTITIDGKNDGKRETKAVPMIYVDKGAELFMNDKVILQYNGTSAVENHGTFTMYGGKITENTAVNGGGIYNTGTFTMNGGEISGNTSSQGGGVYNAGTFTMNGGVISGNTASKNGGGVYVSSGGTFTKTGGTIYGYIKDDTTVTR